jgi:hypothetical protein
MEGAAEDAKDTDQRAKIKAKAEIARDQAGELQKMVDDKFNAKGELVAKALHNEKIAGQIASIQRATGLEDDPEKVASYKEKMVELKQKYKEDLDAIKALEPSEEEQAAEIKQKQKEKKAAEKLAKKQASASESLVNRANEIGLNELAIEIESKLDWQLHEGTALHQKYDEIIKKAEYTNTLNESKYQTLSVKDRFSRLL